MGSGAESVDASMRPMASDEIEVELFGDSGGGSGNECKPSCHARRHHIGGRPKTYHGKPFHEKCFVGVRAFHRTVAPLGPALVDEAKRKMRPDEWRKDIRTFTQGTNADRAEARIDLRKKYSEVATAEMFNKESAIKDAILLDSLGFRCWMRSWRDVADPSQADTEFARLLADQGNQYEDDDGAPRVSVKDFERVRSENGVKRSTAVEMKTEIGEEEFMAQRSVVGKVGGG